MLLGNRLKLGGTIPSGFSPTEISDLLRWGKPSEATTINAGSPTDGDPVTTSGDLSVSGNDLTQSSGLNKMLWKTTYLESIDANDHLESASTDFNFGDEDFSVVIKVNFDVLGDTFIAGKYLSPSNYSYLLFIGGTTVYGQISSNGTSVTQLQTSYSITAGTDYVFAMVHDSVANVLKISVNGDAFELKAHGGGAFASSTEPYQVGFPSLSVNGKIYEDFVYGKALSIEEVNQLVTYLS